VPEPRLDQTPTIGAINAYQNFIDYYPDSPHRENAQQRLFLLQDNLVRKEYLSAKLYYNLGGYFGNINANTESNYEACIITAQNALKQYPFTSLREDFSVLIMKSKFELAENSSNERRVERYRDAEDECYGFINEFPESQECKTAQKYIAKCKRITGN
jgi:outer membrane protein assembly factor BamD